jgi:hypothetical protein
MYWKDLAERVVATFLQALVAAFGTSGLTGLSWLHTILIAVGAALLAVAKGLAARLTGDPDSASIVELSTRQ